MDLKTVIEGAMQLGVIPAVALYLVVSLHRQNGRLTQLLDRREQDMAKINELMIKDLLSKKGANEE